MHTLFSLMRVICLAHLIRRRLIIVPITDEEHTNYEPPHCAI
jgi:hypothetical protein